MRKILITGNVTKDAEVRVLDGGKSVINFDLAVNERWKDKSGVKQEKTHYVKCALWRDNTAIAQYLLKGVKLLVEGSPEVEAYMNKEGKAVANQKVNVRELEFLSSAKKDEGQAQGAASRNTSQSNETLVPDPDQDLPF
jgi:single-strand DNA-binding protein